MASKRRKMLYENKKQETTENGLGDVSLPGAASFHTHSAKFPIEREVILNSGEKNCKIPILTEYMRKAKPGVAPDAPSKQIAWTHHKVTEGGTSNMNSLGQDLAGHRLYKAEPMSLVDSSQASEPSPICPTDRPNEHTLHTDVGGPVTSTPEEGPSKGFPSRTYHSIKDMISSRFGGNKGNESSDSLSPQSQLRQHGVYLASSSQDVRHAANSMQGRNEAVYARLMTNPGGYNHHIVPDGMQPSPGATGVFGKLQEQQQQGFSAPNQNYVRRQVYNMQDHRHSQIYNQDMQGSTSKQDTGATPRYQQQYAQDLSKQQQHRQQVQQQNYVQEMAKYQHGSRQDLSKQPIVYTQEMVNHQTQQGPIGQDIHNHHPHGQTGYMQEMTHQPIYTHQMYRQETPAMRHHNYQETTITNKQPQIYSQDSKQKPEYTQETAMVHTQDKHQAYSQNTPKLQHKQQQQAYRQENGANQQSAYEKDTPSIYNTDPDGAKSHFINKHQSIDSKSDSKPQTIPTSEQVSNGCLEASTHDENTTNHQQATHRKVDERHDNKTRGFNHTEGNDPRPCSSSKLSQQHKVNNDHDDDEDEGGFVKAGGQTDSGRGSTVYSSGKAKPSPDPSTNPGGGDAQWADLVETELRNILGPNTGANSTVSESISSVSPPLPPLSPTASSDELNHAYKKKSLSYGSKGHGSAVWVARTVGKDRTPHHRSHQKSTPKASHNIAASSLEIDSMLDENNSSDEDLEYTDIQTIRKQLEGLENMYSQVLKLLGVKKQGGRYEASDPRINKRRNGSISSLPSSVSSRPIRDKRRETRNKVRDMKGINKRFQRLESHVVTLARSVAHLSSEMRTQHLMMQEMEVMRGELASLRVQANMAATQARLAHAHISSPPPANSTPEKVKKLTKFFGDEPPLLRLFLKKLGYEKYAALFEKERIGLVELPYLSEERLHKLGIPLGPRLRIMQQAQLAFATHANTLCIV